MCSLLLCLFHTRWSLQSQRSVYNTPNQEGNLVAWNTTSIYVLLLNTGWHPNGGLHSNAGWLLGNTQSSNKGTFILDVTQIWALF